MISVRVRGLAYILLAFATSGAGQDCPVAVGTGCDRIWLLANAKSGSALPDHFRFLRLPNGTFVGESGSAQPSADGYAAIRSWLGSNAPVVKSVSVFDLRQESHGFINGLPVSWYFGRDQVNCGKSAIGMAADERERLRLLSTLHAVQIYMSATQPSDTACKAGTDPKQVAVSNVEAERTVVEQLSQGGVQWAYWRLPVADFHAPADGVVDDFVVLIRSLPPNSWLHFHCAAGDGRTTTFLTMAEMVRNARSMTLDAILADQCNLGPGAVNLCSYCGPARWKNEWARLRYRFIELFYLYCREQGPAFGETFSAWKRKNEHRVPPPPRCPNQPPCATTCKTPPAAMCEDC